MNDIVGKVLEQDKAQKWHFIGTGVVLTGLIAFLFYIKRDEPTWQLPAQLETMWFGAMTYIAAAYSKAINKVEQVLNKDLDGDGDIGVDNQSTQAIQTAQASPVQEVAKVVSYADAESDPSKYNLQGYSEQAYLN